MSPVIGMILVLAISVVGIAGVMHWGLPAIDEMKANVEVKSVRAQMQELLADVQELEAGTAGKTTKRWQPSMSRGFVLVNDTVERWAISWNLRSDESGDTNLLGNKYNFTYADVNDTDHVVHIKHGGWSTLTGSDISMKAFKVEGTLNSQIVISENGTSATQPANIGTDWVENSTRTFHLTNDGSNVDFYGYGLRIDIYDDGTLVSQLWVFDTGSVHYHLPTKGGERELVLTNGGLMEGTSGLYSMLNSPPIAPPKSTTNGYRLFGRVIEIDGDLQYGGDHRFDILFNLYGTSGLADITCTIASECVKDVKIYPLGKYAGVWRAYYTNDDNGYQFHAKTNAMGAYDATTPFLLDWKPRGMAFTLIHSVVTAEG